MRKNKNIVFVSLILFFCLFFPINALAEQQVFFESFDSLQSILGNNGTFSHSQSSFESGIVGNALHLRNSEYIIYPLPNPQKINRGTIEFVFKGYDNGKGIFELDSNGGWGAGRPYIMGFSNYDKLWNELNHGQFVSVQTISPNEWHHAAFVWNCGQGNNGLFNVYLDSNAGVRYNWPNCDTVADFVQPLVLRIGTSSWYGSGEITIDEFRVFDYAKTQAQITQDYISYFGGTVACFSNSDCGTDGWIAGTASCSGNDVYQTWRAFTCNNPGTTSASCSQSDTQKLKQDCGDTSYDAWSANYCNGSNVEKSRTVHNKGCSAAACTASDSTEKQTVQTCQYGCTSGACNATPPTKPQSTGSVKVSGRKLLVNGSEFKVKSIGYAPTPIGQNPEWGYDITVHPELQDRDFPFLRAMGANAIRTWGKVNSTAFLDAAWNSGNQPIRVIMGYWMGNDKDYTSASVRQAILADFNAYVKAYKGHSAVLMWAIGNEENWFYGAGNNAKHAAYFSLVNEMAKNAYQIEGSAYHPVAALALEMPGSIATVGNTAGGADDASIPYVDIWGINHYPGKTFGNFFNNFVAKSSKPLLITEYGIDALDNRTGTEYEATQAEWDVALWKEIAASTVSIGGSLMAYSDEWWKDYAGNAATHDYGGYASSTHPDGFSNEEWWGIMRTQDNGSSSDIMTPRQVYYALKTEFGGSTTPTCSRNSDCGIDNWTGSPFCQSNNVYQNYITYTCNNPGTTSSSCSNATTAKLKQTCTNGCTNGTCNAGPGLTAPWKPLLFHEPFESRASVQANGWSITGSPEETAGKLGNALYFTPLSGAMHPLNSAIDSNAGTIELWFNPSFYLYNGDTGVGLLEIGQLGNPNSMALFIIPYAGKHIVVMEARDASGNMRQSWTSQIIVKEGLWHHVALTWKCNQASNYIRVFFNGSGGTTEKGACRFLNLSGPIRVAKVSGYYGNRPAKIDDLRIYSYLRSSAQIGNDYKHPQGAAQPRLTAPANGAAINSSQLFSWEANGFTKFKVEVSKDNKFSKPTAMTGWLLGSSTTFAKKWKTLLALNASDDDKVLYWRIKGSRLYDEEYSEGRAFSIAP